MKLLVKLFGFLYKDMSWLEVRVVTQPEPRRHASEALQGKWLGDKGTSGMLLKHSLLKASEEPG